MKEIEESEKSNKNISGILERLSDGFFSLSRDLRFTYINNSLEKFTGIKKSQINGKILSEVFPHDSRIYEQISYCMGSMNIESFEFLCPFNKKWTEISIYPSEDGASVYFKDISERKISEQKLKETQFQFERIKRLSDIGALSATVAHELRNPLAVIRTCVFNVRRKAQNPLLDSNLLNIEKKIEESERIISNLLFYSRIKDPHIEPTDLFKIMTECLNLAQKLALGKKIKVVKKFRVLNRVLLNADTLQMKELFMNILNNAYDAIHKRGIIEIEAVKGKDNLVIYFRDSGVGMDELHLSRCHEPFFTTKSRGTGLGLSVCFQIVSLHNGKIEISSKKGQGTMVKLTMPLKNPL